MAIRELTSEEVALLQDSEVARPPLSRSVSPEEIEQLQAPQEDHAEPAYTQPHTANPPKGDLDALKKWYGREAALREQIPGERGTFGGDLAYGMNKLLSSSVLMRGGLAATTEAVQTGENILNRATFGTVGSPAETHKARKKLGAINQQFNERSWMGPELASAVQGIQSAFMKVGMLGSLGAGAGTVATVFASDAVEESLREHPDRPGLAVAHGAIEGGMTLFGYKLLAPSTKALLPEASRKASGFVSRAIGRNAPKLRDAWRNMVGQLESTVGGRVSSELAAELPTTLSHYMADVSAGITKFDWRELTDQLSQTALVAGGTAGAAEVGRYVTTVKGITEDSQSLVEQEIENAEKAVRDLEEGLTGPAPKPTAKKGVEYQWNELNNPTVAQVTHDGAFVGSVRAQKEGNNLQIKDTMLNPSARGKGIMSAVYGEFARQAAESGGMLQSDNNVSVDAARLYRSLKTKGYDVARNPTAVFVRDKQRWEANGPVFSVSKAPEGVKPVDPNEGLTTEERLNRLTIREERVKRQADLTRDRAPSKTKGERELRKAADHAIDEASVDDSSAQPDSEIESVLSEEDTEFDKIVELDNEAHQLQRMLLDDANIQSPEREQLAADLSDRRAILAERLESLAHKASPQDSATAGGDTDTVLSVRKEKARSSTERAKTLREKKEDALPDTTFDSSLADEAVDLLTETLPPVARPPSLIKQAANIKNGDQLDTFLDGLQKAVSDYDHKTAVNELKHTVRKVDPSLAEGVLADIDLSSDKQRATIENLRNVLDKHPELEVPKKYKEAIDQLEKVGVDSLTPEEIRDVVSGLTAADTLNKTNNVFKASPTADPVDVVVNRVIEDITNAKPGVAGDFRRAAAVGSNITMRSEDILAGLSESLRFEIWEQGSIRYEQELAFTDADERSTTDFLQSIGLNPERSRKMFGRGGSELHVQRNKLAKIGSSWFTWGEAVEIAARMKDSAQANVLRSSGITADRLKKVRKTKTTTKVTDAVMRDIDDFIGPKGQQVAQFLFDRINGPNRERVDAAWKTKYGAPLSTRNDYFPKHTDPDYLAQSKDVDEGYQQIQDNIVEGYSITKERVDADAPVRIGDIFDTYSRHSDQTSKIAAYLNYLDDTSKLLKSDVRVKQAIVDATSESTYNGILESIKSQVMQVSDIHPESTLPRGLTNGFGLYALGGRISTAFMNVNGLFTLAGRMPKGYRRLAQGLVDAANPLRANEIEGVLRGNSPYWRHRNRNFKHEISSGMMTSHKAFVPRSYMDDAMMPTQIADKFGQAVRGSMVRSEMQEAGTYDAGPDFAKQWAFSMFRSESTSHGLEATGAIRAGRRHGLMAPFVQFESGASKQRSLFLHAKNKAAVGSMKAATTALGAFLSANMFNAILDTILGGARNSDESLGLNLAQRSLQVVPEPAGQAVQAAFNQSLGLRAFDPTGNSVTDFISSATNGIGSLGAMGVSLLAGGYSKEGSPEYLEHFNKAVKEAAPAVSMAFRVPFAGTFDSKRIIKYALGLEGKKEINQDILKSLRELDDEKDSTPERNSIWAAVRREDDALFLEAFEDLANKRPDRANMKYLARTVRGKYNLLDRLEKNPEIKLTPSQAKAIEHLYNERKESFRALESLIERNMGDLQDIYEGRTGR